MNGLFDFSFRDPSGFFIAFVPGLIDLALVVYILCFLPQNRITRVFLLMTISIFFWQMSDSVERIVVSKQAADAWDCIFSAGWLFIGPLSLQFSLLYSGRQGVAKRTGIFMFLYLPAVIFMGLYGSHVYPHPFNHLPYWGWVNFHNSSATDILQIYWISVLVLSATALLFYHTYRVRKDHDLKYQSLLITLGIAIPTFSGIITQVIFPTLLGKPAIPVSSTFMTAFSIATVIALKKYSLFSVSDLIGDEQILEAIPVMVMHISGQNRITYINRFGMNLLGIRREDLAGLRFETVLRHLSPKERPDFERAWERVAGGEELEILDSSLITPKGKIDLLLSLTPVVNNGLVNGVLFIGRDITELKRSYQLITDNELLLREAQRLSRTGSWKWDILTDTVSWSDELFRIYGFAPGEITVNYETFLQAMIPEDRPQVEQTIRQAMTDHRPFAFFYHIRKKDGTVSILHSRGRVTADENQETIRMDGTCQDVTESWNRERQLEEQNLELKKINLELDRFVYSVSHDLRGPLASVMGIVSVAEMETSDPQVHSYLSLIRKSMGRLDKFILDILDYSRNARADIKSDSVDLSELLREVTEDARFVDGEPDKVKICTSVEQEIQFRSDRMRLGIILHNLVANAVHYHDAGAETPYVNISVTVSANGADIAVSDNGIGIKEEQQEKVFEMFYRGSEKSRGSGLGLYIVREAVQKLGGRIILESAPGKGSTFRIHLPAPEEA